MFEILESKVLAIPLSTFLVVAFIAEKAAGIIATQFRLSRKRNEGNTER